MNVLLHLLEIDLLMQRDECDTLLQSRALQWVGESAPYSMRRKSYKYENIKTRISNIHAENFECAKCCVLKKHVFHVCVWHTFLCFNIQLVCIPLLLHFTLLLSPFIKFFHFDSSRLSFIKQVNNFLISKRQFQ